jgi:hypothetical protein
MERRPQSEEQPVFRFLPVPTLSILSHRSIDADVLFWLSCGGDADSPLTGRPVLVAIACRRLNGTPPRHDRQGRQTTHSNTNDRLAFSDYFSYLFCVCALLVQCTVVGL